MKLLKLTLAVLAAALVASGTQAAMVNGAITFAGAAKFDTASLATATAVTDFRDTTVQSEDGDFMGLVSDGDTVVMAEPYQFVPSVAVDNLWSVGGFTFDLDGSTVVLQNADFLLVTGTGTITGNGFDPTVGMWSFTAQSPSADGFFSFSASGDFHGVPDGGSTVALLGLGLAGVEMIRRKLLSA